MIRINSFNNLSLEGANALFSFFSSKRLISVFVPPIRLHRRRSFDSSPRGRPLLVSLPFPSSLCPYLIDIRGEYLPRCFRVRRPHEKATNSDLCSVPFLFFLHFPFSAVFALRRRYFFFFLVFSNSLLSLSVRSIFLFFLPLFYIAVLLVVCGFDLFRRLSPYRLSPSNK